VEDGAPAPVVVAARLGASREVRGSVHHFVIGATSRRRVGFAPVHVENLQAGVGIGLTTGTEGAGDARGVRKVVRHRLMARIKYRRPFFLRIESPVVLPCKIKPPDGLGDHATHSSQGRDFKVIHLGRKSWKTQLNKLY